jgi:hypothetical protein
MNEFAARKLGEVLAFCEVGSETFTKGKSAFNEVFGEERVSKILEENRILKEGILNVMEKAWKADFTLNKAKATGEKLKNMRDFYVGDEWYDAAEMLEWSGFFLGAAVVHWKLVEGAAEELGNETLKNLSVKGVSFNEDLLDSVCEEIRKVGVKKARS